MLNKTRSFLFSLTIITVLVFSAIGPTIAYADDGTAKHPPRPKFHGSDGTRPNHDGVSATLVSVPSMTSIKVIGAHGEKISLATQQAANAISTTSDPIWCPQGQPPVPGVGGCTTSFPSFTALLNFLSGNSSYQGAGTIYVSLGTYNGGESSINFNSFNLTNISNSDLTIQGGLTSNNTVDPNATSNFTIPIIVGSTTNPWGGSVTVNNIILNNVNSTALTVYSQNNINISNVQATGSVTGSGAELHAGGGVNINNSHFDRNRQTGAIIDAGGNVSVANSTFSNPGTNRLQMAGLDITSGGSVALLNVQADGNREAGATINAVGRVSIANSTFSGTKSSTTTSCPGSSSQFCGYGLWVKTDDAIDLDTVTGNDNFLWGAKLEAGKDVNIANSIFNANTTAVPVFIDDTGLVVLSQGNVNLNNVQANDNRLYGAQIEATGTVSVNNSMFTNNNGITTPGGVTTYDGIGLQITSSAGSIFLNNVTASNNTLYGANLVAALDVAIANSTFSNNNTTGAPSGVGLQVVSGGNIFLDSVLADNNLSTGINLDAAKDIFLDNITATNNGQDGVAVQQANCTHLNGGVYSGNTQYGLNLINSPLDLVSPPVFASNGAGDIFPATPGACIVPAGGGGSGGSGGGLGNNGGSTSSNSEASPTLVSLASINGKAGFNALALFSNSNPLFGGSFQFGGSTVKIGFFTGRYVSADTAHGLQIFALIPVSANQLAMGN